MQQTSSTATARGPLLDEVIQLKMSLDNMNFKAAEILQAMDNVKRIGADHIAMPSAPQPDLDKLDREWEYFEMVCDQVYATLENSRYKLEKKRAQLQERTNRIHHPNTNVPSSQPPPYSELDFSIVSPGSVPLGLTSNPYTQPSATMSTLHGDWATTNAPLDSTPSGLQALDGSHGSDGSSTLPDPTLISTGTGQNLAGGMTINPTFSYIPQTDGSNGLSMTGIENTTMGDNMDALLDFGDIGRMGGMDGSDMVDF